MKGGGIGLIMRADGRDVFHECGGELGWRPRTSRPSVSITEKLIYLALAVR